MRFRTITACTLALLAGAAEASAQLPSPSARSFGFAGSYTARARGYEAPFWNPANLALPDRPGWSVGLPAASALVANNSLTYGQITDLYGTFLDDQTKSELLADIRRDDPNRMFELDAEVGAHWLGMSLGHLAIGGGTIGGASLDVTPDAVELLLFGNIGENGTGKDFNLDGSAGLAWSVSSAYVSYAQPIALPALDLLGMKLAVGASFKYEVAHGLVRLRDKGTLITSDPLAVNVDAEVLNSNGLENGNGWSVDLGAAMQWGSLTLGLAAQNALGNVSWDASGFDLTLVTATADFDSTASTDTTLAFAELSPADQARVEEFLADADFPTRLRLGGEYRLSRSFSVSADYEESVGGALRSGWDRTLAVGAELNLFGALPLRAGLASDFEDFAYAGGVGLYAGPFHTDLSVGRLGVTRSDGVVAALSISVWPGMWH